MRALPVVLFGAAAAGLVVFGLSGSAQAATKTNLSPQVVAIAKKWAAKRGLPLDWVLATILSESNGNRYAQGDGGVSIGLMQVNTRAHAAALAREGVTRDRLFDPDVNIDWGTRVMKDAYDRVRAALVGHATSVPTDVLVRLTYKGVDAPGAVRAGYDPRTSYASSVTIWQQNLARASALV